MTALCVYLLLAYLKFQSKFDKSLQQIIRLPMRECGSTKAQRFSIAMGRRYQGSMPVAKWSEAYFPEVTPVAPGTKMYCKGLEMC